MAVLYESAALPENEGGATFACHAARKAFSSPSACRGVLRGGLRLRYDRPLDPWNLKRIIPAKETARRRILRRAFSSGSPIWVGHVQHMQQPTRILLLALGFGATAGLSAQTHPGADPAALLPGAPITLEELRVTADLWESPLDRIAASVSVYDEPFLRNRAVRHFGDLVDQIPNLTWTGGTSRPRYLQIRGIGENSQYEGETPDSAVRFLVDDLDFTGLGTVGSAFDVRQVEVLRGPQAGAFGANAAGGVVRLVTNAPTPFWSGRLEASLGEDALRAGGFAVGGPLVDHDPHRLMMRLAVHQHESRGFRRNLTLNRYTNARDEFHARLRLVWNPNDLWTWESTVFFADVNNGFDEFALDNNGRYTYSDQPGRDEQDSIAASLRGTYRGWDHARLTSVTSAAWTDSVYSYDDDWTAASYQGFSDLRRDRTVFNQELRLDSVNGDRAAGWIDRWTLGGFYSRVDEDSHYRNEDPGNLRLLDTRYRSENYAAFGQVAHDLTPAARLILGLRGERIELQGNGLRNRFRRSRDAWDPTGVVSPRFNDTMVGGKLTFEHDLSPQTLVFGSVTRGYKAGGINVDARIDPTTDPLTYETEYLWNWEAGVRGHALEQRLRGELVGFYLRRQDTQVRDSAGFGGSYRFFTDNANRAEVRGMEASGAWAVTEELSLRASLALMSSSIDTFVLSNGNQGGGRRLANTPRYGYTLGAHYQMPQGFFATAEWVGRGSHFDSNNHDEQRRAFGIVNASLGYHWGQWTFTLWGRNVFNERYDKRVFLFGNEPPDYLPARYTTRADPRQMGVSATWQF
jgi:iron complex outermembrane recepter protein